MLSTPSLRRFPNVAFEMVWFWWLSLILSRQIVCGFLFPCLSSPCNWLCGVRVFVPMLKVLQHFRSSETGHLQWLLCPLVYLLSYFPSLQLVQGSTHAGVFEGGCQQLTFQSGLPIPLFTFCNKLIESVKMEACLVRLPPLEAIQRRVWVTASTSIVKLEVKTI